MQPWIWLFGDVTLPTYPLAIGAAVVAATPVLLREADRSGLRRAAVLDAVLAGVVVGAIGARLFHVVVEAPGAYWRDPGAALSLSAGWTYAGGLLGGLAGAAALTWARGAPVARTLDALAPAIVFGQAIARLGCLGAGCCHGRPAAFPLGFDVPWAVTVDHPGRVPDEWLAVPLHPAPLYLSFVNLGVFLVVSAVRHRSHPDGRATAALLMAWGLGRALVEPFRGDVARGLFLDGWLSASQIVGLTAAVVGAVAWRALGR